MASSGAKIPALNSPTSDEEPPVMPQWKKELIQRRKNLAKTIGTSASNIIYDLGTCPIAPSSSSVTGAIVHKGHSHSNNYAHTSSLVEEKPATTAIAKVKSSSTKTADFSSFVEAETPFASSHSQLHSNDGRENIDAPSKYDKNCDIIKDCESNKDQIVLNSNSSNSKSKMVAATEEFVCAAGEEPEELKYGPGIVSKLRCRYLSLALRQANAKQRPSINNLRRATSLNNLLDESDTVDECDVKEKAKTPDEYIPAFQKNQACNRSRLQDKKNDYNRYKQRGNESLKRARSVETLTRYNHNGKENNFNHDNVIILDEITTNGHHHHHHHNNNNGHTMIECVTIEDKIIHGREKGDPKPKRLMSYIDADERPPPDVVKQTLKIFEATANRRPVSRQNGGEVAAKVATYKSIISQEKPAIVHPKPPLSPKKPNIKPRTTSPIVCNNNAVDKSKFAMNKEKPALPKLDINIIKNNLDKKAPTKSNDVNLLRQRPASPLSIKVDYRVNTTISVTNKFDSPIQSPLSGALSPNISSPYRTTTTTSTTTATTNVRPESPRKHIIIPPSTTIESPSILQLTSKLNNLNLTSPKVHQPPVTDPDAQTDSDTSVDQDEYNVNSINDDDIIDEIDELSDDNAPVTTVVKKVSKVALENISKAGGYTAQFNFSKSSTKMNGSNRSNSNCSDDNNSSSSTSSSPITVPAMGNATTISKIPLNRDKLQLITNIKSSAVSISDNSNGRNFVVEKNQKISSTVNICENNTSEKCNLTIREIEKNQINKEKSSSCEDNDFLAKWGNNYNNGNSANNSVLNKIKVKPPPQHQVQTETNSMIFNFSDRKDVPDYIENDGLILRRKRELPKPGESGFVVLGDLTLDSSTSDPDDPWALGPPSPCDVEFENANVVIDGKSSIRQKTREIKFKIQFDDSLTATFEYPSETSLLDTNGYDDVDANEAYCPEYNSTFADNLLSHTNKLLSSMPLGSAPFASYTPVKAPIDTPFELGVTTANSEHTSTSSTSKETQNSSSATASASATDEDGGATNDGGQTSDLTNGANEQNASSDNNVAESLQYLKPASDEQTVNWSQVSDLLF